MSVTRHLPPPPPELWEVTFLRRLRPGRAPRVAGRMRIAAPSAPLARAAAAEGMSLLAVDGAAWSLGLLCPLAPAMAGTHLYRVIFAAWVEEESEYRREDVPAVEVWATDGDSARRLARQQAEARADYRGAWRIRRVERVEGAGGGAADTAAIAA